MDSIGRVQTYTRRESISRKGSKEVMTEQQVEKIIEHLESIRTSLDYIANEWADGNEDMPIHIVDSTKQYHDDKDN